jgi:MYND finger
VEYHHRHPSSLECWKAIANVVQSIECLAANATDVAFARLDPATELFPFIDVICRVFAEKKDMREIGAIELLYSQCIFQFSLRPNLVSYVANCPLLSTLTRLMDSFGKDNCPFNMAQAPHAFLVIVIGINAGLHTCGKSSGQATKKLFQSGMLKHALRLSTAPNAHTIPGLLTFLDQLISYPRLVGKYFARGSDGGNVLEKLSQGEMGHKDPHTWPTPVVKRIEQLYKLLQMMTDNNLCDTYSKLNLACKHCDKPHNGSTATLMRCARCHSVYYCGKDCQRADWKKHKPGCCPRSFSKWKNLMIRRNFVDLFIGQNFCRILKGYHKSIKEFGVSATEFSLVLDYLPVGNDECFGSAYRGIFSIVKTDLLVSSDDLCETLGWEGKNVTSAPFKAFLESTNREMKEGSLLTISRTPYNTLHVDLSEKVVDKEPASFFWATKRWKSLDGTLSITLRRMKN